MASRPARWLLGALGVGVAGALLLAATHAGRIRSIAKALRSRNLPVDVRRDVVYRTLEDATLTADVYTPRDGESRHAAIVMYHGGAWRSGSKEQVADIAAAMSRMGYVVVVPNYRLAPRYTWPAQIEDARAAVRWTRRHAGELGLDPGRIAAVGFSAGAHLAALVGTLRGDRFLGGDTADVSAQVQAVVAVSGPYDLNRWALEPDSDYLAYFLGGTYRERPQAYLEATPMRHVTHQSPPFMLIHGADDELVAPENDRALAEALRRRGVRVEVLEVRNAGHVLAPSNSRRPSPSVPEVFVRAAEFLESAMKQGG
jgi:acetyl esterase/lipase